MSRRRLTAETRQRNADADWDRWPVDTYLRENYRRLHPCDDAVLIHHSRFYRSLCPGEVTRSVEIGAGPNLYPLLLAAGTSDLVHAVDLSSANVAYLLDQVRHGADESWQPFYDRCRALNPRLPATMSEALATVWVQQGDVLDLATGGYDLGSMNFVAESISEDLAEVTSFCGSFARSVRPGGHIVASFMENQARYNLGDGSAWPGCPVTAGDIGEMFRPYLDVMAISRIDADPELPDYYGGYTGMILLSGRRRVRGPSRATASPAPSGPAEAPAR